jgi:hypothetical protein
MYCVIRKKSGGDEGADGDVFFGTDGDAFFE